MSNNAHIIHIGTAPINSSEAVITAGGFDWFATLAAIRSLTTYYDGLNVGVFSNSSIYQFVSTSTAIDDGADVLLPDNISSGPGRFIRKLELTESSAVISSLVQQLTVAGVTVGNLIPGHNFPIGTTLEDIFRAMLIKQIDPDFAFPTISLDTRPHDSGSSISIIEIGEDIDIDLIAAFVKNDAGAFSTFQYLIGTTLIANTVDTLQRYNPGSNIGDETLQFSVEAFYADGSPKNDNLGDPVANPIGAGSVTASKTLRAAFRAFFGYGDVTSGASVRNLAENVLDIQEGDSFEIFIPQGQTIITFAYPLTLRNPQSVIYQEAFNTDLVSQGIFTLPDRTLLVPDVAGFSSYSYKIFQQVLPTYYDTDVHYTVNV